MRVIVRHGHFTFYPRDSEDVARFTQYFQTELVPEDDYFTFPALKGLPRYSIAPKPFGNLPAVVTYEGRRAWDVMRENEFVYDVTTELLVPALAVVHLASLAQATYYWVVQRTLLQPGAILPTGQRLLSYDAEFLQDWQQLRLRSVGYE